MTIPYCTILLHSYTLALPPPETQGPDTEADQIFRLTNGIRSASVCEAVLTNYKRDSSAFRHRVTLHPVCDSKGRLRYVYTVLYYYTT